MEKSPPRVEAPCSCTSARPNGHAHGGGARVLYEHVPQRRLRGRPGTALHYFIIPPRSCSGACYLGPVRD
eukprot:scaffold1798_cov71-Phaeocystis_antarctica.AAC.2